ncbi:MAG: flagellar hook-associated protein FlgL [Halanaerobiales bacterium]|nr:flagellar hook-associated protein FlgL [Halanaerobiales bacterium]
MRLTSNMMVKNLMRNLNNNYKKMDRLSNELSTGRKIMQPSDDPVASLRSMQLQTVIHQNEQYIKNIDQAIDWIDTSESALDEVNSVLLRGRELAIYGASDTLDQEQRDSIRLEIEQLAEHLVQISNTSIGGRFVFSGHKTTTKPYADYNSAYQGDINHLGVEISKSVSIDYSIPGNSVFDQAFDAMRDMINDLSTGNITNLSTTTLNKIDEASDISLAMRSHLGSKVKRLELAKNRFEDANIKHTQLLTELENVDIAETIMNFKNEENVYRASLSVGARVIQPSLIDFLK